jgi:hypothetical protein
MPMRADTGDLRDLLAGGPEEGEYGRRALVRPIGELHLATAESVPEPSVGMNPFHDGGR